MAGHEVVRWLWEQGEEVAARIRRLVDWFRGKGKPDVKEPGILIIGPGGSGKTTLGKILSGQYDLLLDLPGKYEESLDTETHQLASAAGVEVVVLPGQWHRQEAAWAAPLANVAAGKYRGIIVLAPYGYDSIGLQNYQKHPLFAKSKDKETFCEDYAAQNRPAEVEILRKLAPHVKANAGKLWLLTLVGKEDLWCEKRAQVEEHYRNGEYGTTVRDMLAHQGHRQLRHEFVFASLVISNFWTGAGERLKKNTAGYDHQAHAESLRRLYETIEALRNWEEGT